MLHDENCSSTEKIYAYRAAAAPPPPDDDNDDAVFEEQVARQQKKRQNALFLLLLRSIQTIIKNTQLSRKRRKERKVNFETKGRKKMYLGFIIFFEKVLVKRQKERRENTSFTTHERVLLLLCDSYVE